MKFLAGCGAGYLSCAIIAAIFAYAVREGSEAGPMIALLAGTFVLGALFMFALSVKEWWITRK